MKTKLFFLLLLCAAMLNFSCSKDKDDPSYQVAGLWIGTYTITQMPQQAPLYYSFIIKPDGKILTEGVGANGVTYYSKGTWTINGNLFAATFTTINYAGSQITQSATLSYNSSGIMTNGTWTDVNNPYGTDLSGTFVTMTRVN